MKKTFHHSLVFAVFLVGLQACTWIHDQILSSQVVNARSIPSFTILPTDPGQEYLQFIAVGDVGTGGPGQRDVANGMAKKAAEDSIAFVLMLGDNFYESGVRSVGDEQWKTKFEDMYSQASLQLPFYAVLGNHDYRLNPQAQVDYTALSTRWRMPDRFYTFSYSIDATTVVQFFCLDTDPLSSVGQAELHSLPETSTITRQLQWLESELSASSARWKIVVGHHTIYSGGDHGDDNELASILEPLFVTYQVDVYICGHDHNQELIKPIKGVHYIVSGAGGKHRDVTWRENTIYAATNHGFAWIRISRNEFIVEFFNRKGTLEYAHAIRK